VGWKGRGDNSCRKLEHDRGPYFDKQSQIIRGDREGWKVGGGRHTEYARTSSYRDTCVNVGLKGMKGKTVEIRILGTSAQVTEVHGHKNAENDHEKGWKRESRCPRGLGEGGKSDYNRNRVRSPVPTYRIRQTQNRLITLPYWLLVITLILFQISRLHNWSHAKTQATSPHHNPAYY
jgi:hypothetical protein